MWRYCAARRGQQLAIPGSTEASKNEFVPLSCDVETVKKTAGVRGLLRRQLIGMGAPLRCGGKRKRAAAKKKMRPQAKDKKIEKKPKIRNLHSTSGVKVSRTGPNES